MKRSRAPRVVPYDIPPVEPSAFARVDFITRLAEQSGWPPREGFHLAMQLVAIGATVEEAKQMFADGTRRVQ